MSKRHVLTICLALLALTSCGLQPSTSPPHTPGSASSFTGPRAMAAVTAAPLASPRPCAGTFITHTLDHTTDAGGQAIHLFDSNGSGVAIGDLDGDARLDLLFANLNGPATILWNQGDLKFKAEIFEAPNTRAVNSVDVDGDGRQDIVFTHRGGGVSYWHNAGDRRFDGKALPGVLAPAYAMAWGDLDGDGALDLVTGSYDSELAKSWTNSFLLSDRAGVYVYTQQRDGSFAALRLARQAQALAIALPDLNDDGRPDLLIGNDFKALDRVWLRTESGWASAAPFAATAESTMSIDQGDIDNDGQPELFSTDMKPYDVGVSTMVAWLPLMATMSPKHDPSDPQIVENVLQVRGDDGVFHNQAYARDVDATGWGWSGKFGDLDNDGFLDLYVVNGMIATELFGHLPGAELVEQNQALRNDGTGHFRPVQAWGLGSTSSGRGMSMGDLDGDGDLDIVANNLRSPAQLFENRLCGGASLEVDLRWPASRNSRAVGARLALHTSAGTYYRDVRAGSGYLSGDPAQVHFGFPPGAALRRLDIRWPDGRISSVDAPATQTLLKITRS